MATATASAAGRASAEPETRQHTTKGHPGRGSGEHRQAAQQAVDSNSTHVRFHIGDTRSRSPSRRWTNSPSTPGSAAPSPSD